MIMNFNFTNNEGINKSYKRFYEKNNYLPQYFNSYNCTEIKDIAPTITSRCGVQNTSGGVLILENTKDMIVDFNFTNSEYINRNYKQFYEENSYLPKIFKVWDQKEVKDIAPTLTSACGITTAMNTILILEEALT